MEKNYFQILNEVNVNGKTEEKNGLTYLSWAFAWGEVKKIHPTANFKIYERDDGVNYWTDGRTCWVKTGVTINEIEHIEYLPVMDYKNKSIMLDAVTSTDVNKTIQRSLTKAVARHGLGLYIYAGEDLPESAETLQEATDVKQKRKPEKEPPQKPKEVDLETGSSFGKKSGTIELIAFLKGTKDEELLSRAKQLITERYPGKRSSELTNEDADDILARLR